MPEIHNIRTRHKSSFLSLSEQTFDFLTFFCAYVSAFRLKTFSGIKLSTVSYILRFSHEKQ